MSLIKFFYITKTLSMTENFTPPQSDLLEGTIHPRMNVHLFGHTKSMDNLLKVFNSGNMHHAWLISGPKGIGKATFCWHALKRMLDPEMKLRSLKDPIRNDTDKVKTITALTNPSIYLCRRPFDEKLKRFKKSYYVLSLRLV